MSNFKHLNKIIFSFHIMILGTSCLVSDDLAGGNPSPPISYINVVEREPNPPPEEDDDNELSDLDPEVFATQAYESMLAEEMHSSHKRKFDETSSEGTPPAKREKMRHAPSQIPERGLKEAGIPTTFVFNNIARQLAQSLYRKNPKQGKRNLEKELNYFDTLTQKEKDEKKQVISVMELFMNQLKQEIKPYKTLDSLPGDLYFKFAVAAGAYLKSNFPAKSLMYGPYHLSRIMGIYYTRSNSIITDKGFESARLRMLGTNRSYTKQPESQTSQSVDSGKINGQFLIMPQFGQWNPL